MPSYRFYVLDAAGSTCDYLVKTCLTDAAARENAARLLPGSCGVEVWCADRLIARLAVNDGAAVPEEAASGWLDRPVEPMAAAAN